VEPQTRTKKLDSSSEEVCSRNAAAAEPESAVNKVSRCSEIPFIIQSVQCKTYSSVSPYAIMMSNASSSSFCPQQLTAVFNIFDDGAKGFISEDDLLRKEDGIRRNSNFDSI
jgi:Ca2+-binding EF-hand superfamily protein